MPHRRGLARDRITKKALLSKKNEKLLFTHLDVKILGLSEDLSTKNSQKPRVRRKRRPRSGQVEMTDRYRISKYPYIISTLSIITFQVLFPHLDQKFPLRNGRGPTGFSQTSYYRNLEDKISDEIYRIENENGYKENFDKKISYLQKKKLKRENKARRARSKSKDKRVLGFKVDLVLKYNKQLAKNWSTVKTQHHSRSNASTPSKGMFYSSQKMIFQVFLFGLLIEDFVEDYKSFGWQTSHASKEQH